MLKRSIGIYLILAVLGILVPLAAATNAGAQTRRYYNSRTRTWTVVKKPGFYRRHRKAVNIGAGTAAGAIVGGLIGGKKGALIGAGAGAGTGYIVTKKQKPKHYTRRYRYRSYRNY
jgi:hypothetical protein